MEIAPGVHAVPLLGATGHLICEDRLTLIDAGLPGSRRRLVAYLARIGRSLDELVRIVCTHGHPDHVGGVAELAGDGVEVLMHPADAAALQVSLRETLRRPSRGKVFAYAARTPRDTSRSRRRRPAGPRWARGHPHPGSHRGQRVPLRRARPTPLRRRRARSSRQAARVRQPDLQRRPRAGSTERETNGRARRQRDRPGSRPAVAGRLRTRR